MESGYTKDTCLDLLMVGVNDVSSVYLKVMFGNKSCAGDGFSYKIGEVNEADNWNPTAVNKKETGGFNFSTEDKIARWLVRGDTLYDVTIPEDAEVIEIDNKSAPHGVFRTNKIILNNPRKVTEKMAFELYKKSKLPKQSYFKVLAGYAVRGYVNVCKIIIEEKINEGNIDLAIDEFLDFYDRSISKIESDENSRFVFQLLKELKQQYVEEDLFITESIDKEPYVKRISDDLVINLTGESGSGKSTVCESLVNDVSIVVDTDKVFGKRVENDEVSLKLYQYLMEKYKRIPNLFEEFDLCYEAILECFKNSSRLLVIDSAQFRNMKDLSKLKGEVFVMRTCIDTCYQRCLDRYDKEHTGATMEKKSAYATRKKKIYQWYHSLNQFILKVDQL